VSQVRPDFLQPIPHMVSHGSVEEIHVSPVDVEIRAIFRLPGAPLLSG
jgi:hypothetical protein